MDLTVSTYINRKHMLLAVNHLLRVWQFFTHTEYIFLMNDSCKKDFFKRKVTMFSEKRDQNKGDCQHPVMASGSSIIIFLHQLFIRNKVYCLPSLYLLLFNWFSKTLVCLFHFDIKFFLTFMGNTFNKFQGGGLARQLQSGMRVMPHCHPELHVDTMRSGDVLQMKRRQFLMLLKPEVLEVLTEVYTHSLLFKYKSYSLWIRKKVCFVTCMLQVIHQSK